MPAPGSITGAGAPVCACAYCPTDQPSECGAPAAARNEGMDPKCTGDETAEAAWPLAVETELSMCVASQLGGGAAECGVLVACM